MRSLLPNRNYVNEAVEGIAVGREKKARAAPTRRKRSLRVYTTGGPSRKTGSKREEKRTIR